MPHHTLFKLSVFITVLIMMGFVSREYFGNHSETTTPLLRLLLSNKTYIDSYCEYYGVDPRLYVSVIYGERVNNVSEVDSLDAIRAALGFNPSIGFGQLRISTADWIERYHADSLYISRSKCRKELVSKTATDSTNILHSVKYVQLISDALRSTPGLDTLRRVNLIASYYGRGIDEGKGIDTQYSNILGDSALAMYRGNWLRKHF